MSEEGEIQYRKVETWSSEDGWQESRFEDLRAGQPFKLYEPDGTLVGAFAAASDPGVHSDCRTMCVAVEYGTRTMMRHNVDVRPK